MCVSKQAYGASIWGDQPVEEKVSTFLARLIPTAEEGANTPAGALVPWVCDVLLSEHSVKGYGRDLAHFAKHMQDLGVDPFHVTADHVKLYKGALLKAGVRPATIARRLSVLRGTYRQFAAKGLIDWETAQDIAAVKAPPVIKNSARALTSKQAVKLLKEIPTSTLKGLRDFALIQTFFITGCRVSALVGARVGDIEHDGVEYYLHVTEMRGLDAPPLETTGWVFGLRPAGLAFSPGRLAEDFLTVCGEPAKGRTRGGCQVDEKMARKTPRNGKLGKLSVVQAGLDRNLANFWHW